MTTWGDFETWSQGELAVSPGETDQNYLFKAVLTGNASLVVKALLAGADPNAPCSTQAQARSFATPGVYRQTDFYARDPGVDVSDWEVYRFNDLRGPGPWHYTESEASEDEWDDDASHATGSTQEEALE